MYKERLMEIKMNSKNAYIYMRKLSKEELYGKTMVDREKFVHKLKDNHTLFELTSLYNDIKFGKESRTEYNKGFFAIVLPFFIANLPLWVF